MELSADGIFYIEPMEMKKEEQDHDKNNFESVRK